MGNSWNSGPAAKIVAELDWNKSNDLGVQELELLIEAMKKHHAFKDRAIDAELIIRESQELAIEAARHKVRGRGRGRDHEPPEPKTKIDVETLKMWFEKEELTDTNINELLAIIREIKPKNPHKVGDHLDILDSDKWRTAVVIKVDGLRIYITYDGWDKQYDEWLHILGKKERIAPHLEKTKGEWTGPHDQRCPYFSFNSQAEDFIKLIGEFEEFEKKYPTEKEMASIDEDGIEYLLNGKGTLLAENMLRARPIEEKEDGAIPAEVLSRYLKLLTNLLKAGKLEEKKTSEEKKAVKVQNAGRVLLDRIMQVLGGDDRISTYYYKNGPELTEVPKDSKYAKKAKNTSAAVVILVNQFGEDGGFQELRERIRKVAENEPGTPLLYSFATISRMIKLVSKLKPILRQDFLENYTRNLDLFNFIKPALSSLDSKSIRTLETSDIKNLGDDIKALTLGVEKAKDVHKFVEETELAVIKLLLQVDQLPKKMDALKFLGNIIRCLEEKKKTKSYNFSWWPTAKQGGGGRRAQQQAEPEIKKLQWINTVFLLKWIETEKIIETVLQPNTHQLVIQLSVPILKFLATNRKLGPHLKTLSNMLTGADSETAKVLSNTIAEVAEKLPENQLKNMFNTFTEDRKKLLKDYTAADLKLIGDFTKSAIKANGGKGSTFGVEIFWDLLQAENQAGLTPDVIRVAHTIMRELLINEIIKDPSVYVKRCVGNLKSGKSVVTSLELLQLMLECQDAKSTSKSILKAQKDNKLLEKFFDDYRNYNNAAARQYDSKNMSGIDEKTVLHGQAPHVEQVKARLKFLRFLIQNSSLALTNEDVDALWEVCVTSSVVPNDISLFMAWLSECMSGKAEKLEKAKPVVKDRRKKDPEEDRKIFDAFDAKSSASMFSKLEKTYKHTRTGKPVHVTPEWYGCFASTFISTNKKNGALNKEGYVIDYSKIQGKGALWNFALREPNDTVRAQAQKFLVSVHIKLDIEAKDEMKLNALKSFLQKCTSELEECKDAIVRDSVMTVVEQLVRRVEAGEMVIRPLFKVGERVKASWKKPADIRGASLYKAVVSKVNSDDEEITYALNYDDGDFDPKAKESYIRTLDEKVKERPPLKLSDAEKFPALYLSGRAAGGEQFLDLAISVLEKGGAAAGKAWALLNLLPYNKQAQEKAKKLPFDDNKTTLPKNPEQLLYMLTILDPAKAYTDLESPLADPLWCMHFVKNGALGELVDAVSAFGAEGITGKPLRRLCLANILHLISFFLTANECQIHVSIEDVIKAAKIEKLLSLTIKYLPHAAKAPEGKALEALLTIATICTRLAPKLIETIPKSADWAEIFAAALIVNDKPEVQAAFTRGVTDLCEHSIALPEVYQRPEEDTKNEEEEEGKEAEENGKVEDGNENDKSAEEKAEDVSLHLDTHRLFIVLDVDQNGQLDAKELQALFHGGKPFPPGVADGVDALITAADANADGKISFKELTDYFKLKSITSRDLGITYGRLSEIKRERDAKQCDARRLRQDVRSHFLPILLSRFASLDTSKDVAQFLILMGSLIRQSESIEEAEAKKIGSSLARLIKGHPMRERNSLEPDTVLGAFMRLTAATITKAPFLCDLLGVKGTRELSLLKYTYDCLFALPTAPKLDKKGSEVKSPKSRGDTGLHPPKCKHPDSRAAAFQLMLALVEKSDENLKALIELLTANHLSTHNDGKRPDVWSFEPPRDVADRGEGFVGLHNCGNTCYINAALQQLFMMRPLRKELLMVDGYDREKKQLLYGTQWLMSHLQESKDRAITPKTFLDSYIDPATGKPVRAPGSGCRQDDSLGFFQTLLSRLEDETKGTRFVKTIPRVLGIGECTEMIGQKETPYLSDHNAKHRNRIATSIQVNVTGFSTLQECLADYVKGEQISGYSGASDPGVYGQQYPQKKITILKRTSFKSLPNTLAIGLNRMKFDWDDVKQMLVGRKQVHRVSFPFELDMKPYCMESLTCPKGYRYGAPSEDDGNKGGDAKTKGADGPVIDPEKEEKRRKLAKEERQKTLALPERSDNYYKYRLMGVIVHSGQTLNSGHYYSFIRERTELKEGEVPPKDGEKGARWYCFNDSSVTKFDHTKLGEETFGAKDGSWKSATAYVLVYERTRPEVVEEPEMKNVPTELLERIWHENRVRVADTNVYNIPYFKFLDKLADYIISRFPHPSSGVSSIKPVEVPNAPSDLQDAFTRLMLRFLFKTLARSLQRQKFWQGFLDQVKDLLEGNIATSTWFISMLIHPTHNWLSELITAPPELVREATVQLFAESAKTISPLERGAYESKAGEKDFIGGTDCEIVKPQRGFVVQAVDILLSQLEKKETSSLVMESLANFASLGPNETKYLQGANILKHMMEALTSEANSRHNLGDAIFMLLNTVKSDLRKEHVQVLFSPQFIERLLIEPYNVKRAKSVVDIIVYLCTPEGAQVTGCSSNEDAADVDGKAEATSRLKVVMETLTKQLKLNNYELTRPYFRVLSGMLRGSDEMKEFRVNLVADSIVDALNNTFNSREPLYRKTDFFAEHMLRLMEQCDSLPKAIISKDPNLLPGLVKFFEKYPDTSAVLGKMYLTLKRVEKKFHEIAIVSSKYQKPTNMAMPYTLTSKYATYGRSIPVKIAKMKEILQTDGKITAESEDGYDSDAERRARQPEHFKIGMHIDVLDTVRKWLLGEVIAIRGRMVEVHYVGHNEQWDEFIEITSPRIMMKADEYSKLEKIYDRHRH